MSKDKLDKRLESMPQAKLTPEKKQDMLHTILKEDNKTIEKHSWKKGSGWLAPVVGTFAVVILAFVVLFSSVPNHNQADLTEESPGKVTYIDKLMDAVHAPTGIDLLLLFIITIFIITIPLTIYTRVKFNIDYEFFRIYRYMNNTHKWIERILLLLFLIIGLVAYFVFSFKEIYVLLFGVLTIMQAFHTYMEHQYNREEKEYLIHLIWTISGGILFIGSLFFMLQTITIADVTKELNPESVEKIQVFAPDKGYGSEIVIEDSESINQIISSLSELELNRRIGDYDDRFYTIYIRGSKFYSIDVYEEYLSIDFDNYKVISTNSIYEMLEEEIDWTKTQENID